MHRLLNCMLKSMLLFAAPSKHLLPWKNRVQIAIDVANALVSFRKYVIVSFFLQKSVIVISEI
jgi:hypothetical protein